MQQRLTTITEGERTLATVDEIEFLNCSPAPCSNRTSGDFTTANGQSYRFKLSYDPRSHNGTINDHNFSFEVTELPKGVEAASAKDTHISHNPLDPQILRIIEKKQIDEPNNCDACVLAHLIARAATSNFLAQLAENRQGNEINSVFLKSADYAVTWQEDPKDMAAIIIQSDVSEKYQASLIIIRRMEEGHEFYRCEWSLKIADRIYKYTRHPESVADLFTDEGCHPEDISTTVFEKSFFNGIKKAEERMRNNE